MSSFHRIIFQQGQRHSKPRYALCTGAADAAAVGDTYNDIPMLEYAGMAFAPENAIPAVHRVPGIRILPDCRENAMAAMIAVLDRRYS